MYEKQYEKVYITMKKKDKFRYQSVSSRTGLLIRVRTWKKGLYYHGLRICLDRTSQRLEHRVQFPRDPVKNFDGQVEDSRNG